MLASPSPPLVWVLFRRTAPGKEPGSECGREGVQSSLVWRGKLVMYLKPDAGIFSRVGWGCEDEWEGREGEGWWRDGGREEGMDG